MKNFKEILFLVSALMVLNLHGQQEPNYTFYRYIMGAVNPAYSGSEEVPVISLNLKSQWQGIDGAPETQTLVASMPLSTKVGLGVSVVNDKTFVEKQTAFYVDFSYKLLINTVDELYLGIKALQSLILM